MLRRLLQSIRAILNAILGILCQGSPPPVPCNCADCPSDPGLTCSYSGEDMIVQTAYVANAYRGNLLLSPGSAMGPIGGLLHSLTPPQHYTHMGIFVSDHDLIRHCTMSQDRLLAPEYYTGSILGQSVPEDGFNHKRVQYGWPGTITQSVEQAFFADRYGTGENPPGYTAPYQGAMLTDWESQSHTTYLMNELSFDAVSDDGQTWYPPLVVQLCSTLQTPTITQALARVAYEALKIYAHYRFYTYTDGSIGEDAEYAGPPVKLPVAMPAWDPGTDKWSDWSGSPPTSWVTVPTIPGVCSSFVWQSVQNANKDRLGDIVLDWAQSHADALGARQGQCVRLLRPDWTGDIIDIDTRDGLYVYGQDERQTAANYLHDSLAEQVYDTVKGKLQQQIPVIGDVLDDIGRGSFIAAAAIGAAAVAGALNSTPLGLVAAGFGASFVTDLIELLYDMPNDVANQMCNAFAFDCINGGPADTHCVDSQGNIITTIDSDNWSSAAGIGRAVSPMALL